MQRYFMTIPEASQLVLQAYTMGTPGDIFVLDMGAPVRVLDLAHRLIRLSAPDPSAIRVEFTGVRPGEKLYEEVNADGEDTRPTGHEKIHVFGGATLPWAFVARQIAGLRRACDARDLDRLLKTLQRLVPEYTPSAEIVSRVNARGRSVPPRQAQAGASVQ
jgi:FlaA1/EpsC-like NDP-sugar epimerase